MLGRRFFPALILTLKTCSTLMITVAVHAENHSLLCMGLHGGILRWQRVAPQHGRRLCAGRAAPGLIRH